jgi:hypothetical protein
MREEHEFEPQYGLPEVLPADERLLWQGSPDWKALARRAFHLRKLALYFLLVVGLRLGVVINDGGGFTEVLRSLAWTLPLAALGLGLVAGVAWLAARNTAYTITDRRVVMRIGIVLTVTFNLPFSHIRAAGMHLEADGTADLPLTLGEQDNIAWLQLWPHVRPWRVGKPEPMLRCVPEGQRVAQILAQAWSDATGQAAGQSLPTTLQAGPAASAPNQTTQQPAWAGR